MDDPYELLRILTVCFAVCILLLLLVVLVRWAAADARKRGKPVLAVVLLSLVNFPLGLLIWIVFRPKPLIPEGPPFPLQDRGVL